jgi:acyl dehydratase
MNGCDSYSAVPSGGRVRARHTPQAVEDVRDGIQITWAITVERRGRRQTCCVAEWLVRYYP